MIAKQPTRPRGSMKSSLGGYECWREFMDKLLEGGIDRYIDLLMIAVMEDTSSGKSSLLPSISFVELPSSDTLTTRCPIRLQMCYAESKWASVKVVWKDIPVLCDPPHHSDMWHGSSTLFYLWDGASRYFIGYKRTY